MEVVVEYDRVKTQPSGMPDTPRCKVGEKIVLSILYKTRLMIIRYENMSC